MFKKKWGEAHRGFRKCVKGYCNILWQLAFVNTAKQAEAEAGAIGTPTMRNNAEPYLKVCSRTMGTHQCRPGVMSAWNSVVQHCQFLMTPFSPPLAKIKFCEKAESKSIHVGSLHGLAVF